MIIKSLCRGDGRKTSAPKRAISYLDPPIDIISIAQQAKPNVMGHIEFFRTQLIAASRDASTTPSGWLLPQFTSSSFSRFLPKLSRVPKMYRSLWLIGRNRVTARRCMVGNLTHDTQYTFSETVDFIRKLNSASNASSQIGTNGQAFPLPSSIRYLSGYDAAPTPAVG